MRLWKSNPFSHWIQLIRRSTVCLHRSTGVSIESIFISNGLNLHCPIYSVVSMPVTTSLQFEIFRVGFAIKIKKKKSRSQRSNVYAESYTYCAHTISLTRLALYQLGAPRFICICVLFSWALSVSFYHNILFHRILATTQNLIEYTQYSQRL